MKFVATCLVVVSLVQVVAARALPTDFIAERRLFVPADRSPAKYIKPREDSFYRAPENLASYKEGDIIRERDVTKDTLIGLDDSAIASAFQLLYRTQSATGAPDVTVTNVYRPKKIAAGGPKVLVAALYQDMPTLDCVNSYALLENNAGSNQTLVALAQTPLINAALNKGYFVTVPDHQGSQSAFIAGYGAGRALLDGTRAILRHTKTIPDPTGHQVIPAGYSGGAAASAWAAQLATEYAPEVNMVGAVAGGTAVNLRSALLNLNGGEHSFIAIAALLGAGNAYPELNTWLLTAFGEEGRRLFKEIRETSSCLTQANQKYKNIDVFKMSPKGAAVLDDEVPKRILELNRLGARGQQDIITKFPTYRYASLRDQYIPEGPGSAYVNDQCSGGASIEYSVSVVSDHVAEFFIGFPRAWEWIVMRFEGRLKQPDCRRTIHGIGSVFSPVFERLTGSMAAEQTRKGLNVMLNPRLTEPPESFF